MGLILPVFVARQAWAMTEDDLGFWPFLGQLLSTLFLGVVPGTLLSCAFAPFLLGGGVDGTNCCVGGCLC